MRNFKKSYTSNTNMPPVHIVVKWYSRPYPWWSDVPCDYRRLSGQPISSRPVWVQWTPRVCLRRNSLLGYSNADRLYNGSDWNYTKVSIGTWPVIEVGNSVLLLCILACLEMRQSSTTESTEDSIQLCPVYIHVFLFLKLQKSERSFLVTDNFMWTNTLPLVYKHSFIM